MADAPSAAGPLASAWAAYDRGSLADALRLADTAAAQAPERWEPVAAQVWFLMETGDLAAADARLRPALDADPAAWTLWWYAGLLRQRQGDLPAAADALRRACRGDPALDAATSLAWVLHDLGALGEAVGWSRRAHAAAPDPDRQRQLAWLLLRTGAADEAARLYGDLLARLPAEAPDRAVLTRHHARALEESGRGEAAENLLRAAAAAAPDDPETLAALGWLHLRHRRPQAALPLAATLCRLAPERAEGWHLRGLAAEAAGDAAAAEAALAEAVRRAPGRPDLGLHHAHLLHRRGAVAAAEARLRQVLDADPHLEAAEDLLLHLLVQARRTAEARQRLHRRLRRAPAAAGLWRLLAIVLDQRGRAATGFQACRRAARLDPADAETFRLLGWLAHRTGRATDAVAAVRRTLALTGADPAASLQAAFLLDAGIEGSAATVAEAEALAERAVALAPENADAWDVLGRLRARQARWDEAETALGTACRLAGRPGDATRHLVDVLLARWRCAAAESLLRDWLRQAPDDPVPRGLLGECALRAGTWDAGLAALPDAATAPPDLAKLIAALHAERGDADAALAVATRLLRQGKAVPEAAAILARLDGLGSEGAAQALRLLPRRRRRDAYRHAIRIAVYRYGHAAFTRLARRGTDAFPEESWFALAAFFAESLDTAAVPERRRDAARRWFRDARRRIGVAPRPALPPVPDDKIRIAYLAAYFHGSLLQQVLAAHDPAAVTVYVYTDAPLPPDLAGTIREPLAGRDLAHAFAANRIDVVIDTVGLHVFEGQDRIVTALVRRLAPVQIAWLGTWGTGGGLYDALLTDAAAVPPAAEALYDEEILRIPGGHWAWTPPPLAQSPDPGPPPSDRTGRPTFASTVRGLRISAETQAAWAAILARVPDAPLWIIGYQAADGAFRRAFADRLTAAGVDPGRIVYHPPCAYRRLLALYAEIDIALDTLPANGGLCLLDPLWMGVPFVTCAGPWASDRQGLSILAGVGLSDLCADDAEDFVERSVALAHDRERRAALRATLRDRVRAAPLTDGARIARFIEREAARLHAAAPVPTTAGRADAAYRRWRRQDGRLAAGSPDAPALSVLLPADAAPGLLWESLSALADRPGVPLEVIAPPGFAVPAGLEGLRAGTPRGRYHLSLAPGTVFAPGALAAAAARLDADPALGGITARLVGADGRLLAAGGLPPRDGAARPHGRGGDPEGPEVRFERRCPAPADAPLLRRPGSDGPTLYLPAFVAQDLTRDGGGPPPGDAARDALIDRWAGAAGPRLLILDDAVPLPTDGAGLPRARLMLRALAGHAVTLYPLWREEEDWREVYRAVPASTEVMLGPGFDGLEGFLETRRGVYQALLVSRPPNLRRLASLRARRPELFAGLTLIYDAEAIFAERENAAAACRGTPPPPQEAEGRIAAELALATGSHRILTVSPSQAERFRAAGFRDVRVLGHALAARRTAPGAARRRDLLFVGALDPETPNEDSLVWFATAILPHLPGVRLTVVGACRSEKIAALANERFRLAGAQEAIEPLYDAARVFIAPTRFASGIPVKVIEAAAHGVPVVATPLLVEQLGWRAGEEIAAAGTPAAFAAAVRRLLAEDGAWTRQQAAAWDRIAADHDPGRFAAAVRAAIADPPSD